MTLSSLRLSESSVDTVRNLIGLSSSNYGTPLSKPVVLELVGERSSDVIKVEIPRRHRVRWAPDRLEIRRGDGGIFFALAVSPGWELGQRELLEASSCLRRLVKQYSAQRKARGRDVALAASAS